MERNEVPLEVTAAIIAGGIVSSHGLDPDAIAERAVAIALAVRKKVETLKLSAV
jgi:hypothetical protein